MTVRWKSGQQPGPRKIEWVSGQGPAKRKIRLLPGETRVKAGRGKVKWTKGQPIDDPPKVPHWKDGEKDRHRFDVEREATLPTYIEVPVPRPHIVDALNAGPGTAFMTRSTLIKIADCGKRVAPLLLSVHQEMEHDGITSFPPGTLVVYTGAVRSPERKWSANQEHTINVVRHLFLIGATRWIILDLNVLEAI